MIRLGRSLECGAAAAATEGENNLLFSGANAHRWPPKEQKGRCSIIAQQQ